MIREFQVLYRHSFNGSGVAPTGEPQSLLLMAEAPDQAEAMMKAGGFCVIAVQFVRVVVDWTMPVFDRDEAAAYLRWKAGTLSANKGDGEIPCADIGGGRYPRAALEAYVNSKLNPAGKELLAA